MSEIFGSPYYIAPDVLSKSYGPKCDVWSCGIIAYIMLCGKPPFNGSTDKEILSAIKKGFYHFNAPEWTGISETCREFISMLLTLNPDNRPTAGEAMEHKWIREALSDSK
jgi:calcium-dependent protein kinase